MEYIIVDGASTDGTLSIIKKYQSRITKYISEPDGGIYFAMNKGLSLATGDIIGFLNADDMYSSFGVLETISKYFKEKHIDACYTDLIYVKRADPDKVIRNWKSCEFDEYLFRNGWCPPHLTFFARKEIYQNFGVFDTSFKLAADFEILMRFLLINKIQTYYIPYISVIMRMGGITNNSFKNVLKQNIEILKAYKKHNIPLSLSTFLVTKIHSRINQYFSRKHVINKKQ